MYDKSKQYFSNISYWLIKMKQMDIGVVIKKYRKEAGMTQEEMANRLGVTTPAVNKWENSNSKPDIELLAPIARLLDIVCVGKDVEGTYKVVKHLLDNVGTMYDFRKSGLYKHMKFRDIDEAILDGVKEKLLEGFRNEEEFGYMAGYEPWEKLIFDR